MESPIALVSLIVGLPLLGFLINGLIGLFSKGYRNQKSIIGVIANLAVFIPFLTVVYLFLNFNADAGAIHAHLYTWLQAGDFSVDIAYQFDQLSLIMALVVTGVGSLIHLYSIGYMQDDEGFWKFFAYMNLFIFAMLNLVLADNLLLLFLGWEGVGLCSFLLIGFWYRDMMKADAAKKAFIYNRVGDFAFLIAIFMIFEATGSLNFDVVLSNTDAFTGNAVFWVAFLMFIGATGKSAQIPLFVWLPDAMAGPTPVSALIHAATMVTSGIYLITRMSPMYVLSPEVMIIVAVIGALTAIVAATIAMTQYDIKGVLAYSTVSQLGFMFLALGSGAYTAALFHVVTHAFFKACLFLGSGSVIHAMHHVEHKLHDKDSSIHFDPQDIRNMGGLKKYMPSTYKTFLIATVAIAGIPPLAGFFSKDEILMHTFNMGLGEFAGPLYFLIWGVATITAFLTAFYMFRLTLTTFHGTFKLPNRVKGAEKSEEYLHESPATMTLPLWSLAGLSIVGGFIGIPNFISKTFGGEGAVNWLGSWMHPVAADISLNLSIPAEWVLMILATIIAVFGVYVAFRMYGNDQQEASDAALSSRFGALYQVWKDKYSLDELYEGAVVHPTVRFSDRVLAVFDMKVLDGMVNATAGTVRLTGSLLRYIQTGITSNYALFMILGVILVLTLILF
ncbi:MAG: NADH-quinone oxidoreductase subunit L [Balneolaceae bacterium]